VSAAGPAGPGRADPRRDVPKTLGLDLGRQVLTVEWHDGHRSAYPASLLRFLCPCAGCRGHVPGEVPPPRWEDVKDVRATGASQVGGYALQFTFSDGHATGIYAYDRLRAECPCEACVATRGGEPR
jgi:DUF971 family protein